jgi:protein-L-isoaspartate(D-aspartate) O-methyltransferase
MNHPVSAYQAARNMMVDGQVRPNTVTDKRIIDAMRRLPREHFVPPPLTPLAYADEDVPLGGGRYLTEPRVIARLVQSAAVRPGERALVVAAGSGYAAALLAACGATVTAVEDDPALLALARAALSDAAAPVRIANGPPQNGWPADAPYDVVLIDGAVEELPAAIAAQVKPQGGRLLMIRALEGRVSQAVLGEPTPAGLSFQVLFDCATPTLASMRRQPGFVF